MNRSCAAIFDMDGVLVDTYQAHYRSWREMAAAEGLPFSEEDFARTFGCTSREVIAKRWAARRFSEAQIAALDAKKEDAFRRIIRENVPLMPGAVAPLHGLREGGFRLAVGSSAPPENVDLVLDRRKLRDLFDAVVTCGGRCPRQAGPGGLSACRPTFGGSARRLRCDRGRPGGTCRGGSGGHGQRRPGQHRPHPRSAGQRRPARCFACGTFPRGVAAAGRSPHTPTTCALSAAVFRCTLDYGASCVRPDTHAVRRQSTGIAMSLNVVHSAADLSVGLGQPGLWKGATEDIDRVGPAPRRPLAARPGIRSGRSPTAEARSLPAGEDQRPAAGHRLDSRRRLEGGQQGLAAGRAARAQGLRRGQHQLSPQPARRLSRPDRGLQGGRPLAAGQCEEISTRPGPHWRVGAIGGRSLRRALGTTGGIRELEGSGGNCSISRAALQCVVDWFGPTDLATMGGRYDEAVSSVRVCSAARCRRTWRRRPGPAPSLT